MENAQRTTSLGVRDRLLMALTVSSGAIDAISYLALGRVFTAFMTGNIVFLGLSMSGASSVSAVRVALALVAFSAGSFLSTLIVKSSKGSGRGAGVWPLEVMTSLGFVIVVQLGFLAVWVAAGGQPSNSAANVLVCVGAFAMGVQSATVLSLGVTGVVTTAVTATVVVLMGYLAARPQSATERWRLAGVLVSLFAGAAAGALLLKHARAYAPVLPVVVTTLALVMAALALQKRGAADDRGADELAS